MPRPSLRRAGRNPKPGAAGCGCPRPGTLRFASPLGASPFGDGTYSGNIVQGGVVLLPQPCLLNGELLPDCVVVTGAATVAPDSKTGAAVFTCRNLVIDGGSLAAGANGKGLLGFVRGKIQLVNSGRIHMDGLGRAGNFGNLTPLDLLPARLRWRVALGPLTAIAAQGEGATGGAAITRTGAVGGVPGVTGGAAAAMQCGGGGSGGVYASGGTAVSGRGGKAGPCCGGAGGGSSSAGTSGAATAASAGDYGGPASAAVTNTSNIVQGGAAGDPIGGKISNGGTAYDALGAGGGLLMLFTPLLSLASGCIVSADGAKGGETSGTYRIGGAGAGGGCVAIATLPGGYSNLGTVRASGGAAGSGGSASGAGGAGSVNIFTI